MSKAIYVHGAYANIKPPIIKKKNVKPKKGTLRRKVWIKDYIASRENIGFGAWRNWNECIASILSVKWHSKSHIFVTIPLFYRIVNIP